MDLSQFSPNLLLAITLVVTLIYVFYNVEYIRRHCHNYSTHFLKMALISPMVCLILFAFMRFRFQASLLTVLLGLAFGFATMLNQVLNARAMETGPLAYYSVIANSSTIITAASGMLFFNDPPLSVTKYIGMACMFVCIFLSIDYRSQGEKKKASVRWLILCVFCMFASASVGLLQKTHQSIASIKDELYAFLLVCFLVCTVFSAVVFAVFRRKEVREGTYVVSEADKALSRKSYIVRLFVLPVVILGIGFAAANILNLYLSGVIPSAVFFPVVNGVPLMEQLLMAFFLFKEKLSKTQYIGFTAGLIGVILLFIGG